MTEKHVCCELVSSKFSYLSGNPTCGKPAKIQDEGKWYCGIHNPQKRRNRHAAWKIKFDAKQASWRHDAALSAARNDVVEAAKDFYFKQSASRTLTLLSAVRKLDELERELEKPEGKQP